MHIVYADNNATTRVDTEVLYAMMPFLTERYGNPSSLHSLGAEASKDLTRAREQVADSLGVKASEIVFTSGGTESDNTALHGALAAQPKKRHIITTAVEHSAILNYTKHLASHGYDVTYVPVDKDAKLDEERLLEALRPDTCIVSVMWANNETGVLFPVADLARKVKAKSPGVLFHTDAVQAMGKITINLEDASVDLLSLSGHKFHAPKGVGVLVVRRGVKIQSMIIGGSHEEGHRAGTENIASIAGLAKACELAKKRVGEMQTRVKTMRDKLETRILAKVPNARINAKNTDRVPNTTSISFKDLEAEPILQALSDEGICASAGSACKKGVTEPSHVLVAMGIPKEWALGTIRFSLGHDNTEKDVDRILHKLPSIVSKLTMLSSRCA